MPNNDSNYIQTYNHPHGQVLINEQTLTNIADAIREQRLTDDHFKPAQFAGEIMGINEIEGGEYEGEIDLSVEEKDVNFYDYDGTRVYSYTKDQFLELSVMPDNPSHNNLIAQGWNWSLSDAKEYVQNYGILDVGQMYDTYNILIDSGNTYEDQGSLAIDIELKEPYLTPYIPWLTSLSIFETEDIGVTWGDGSPYTCVHYNNQVVSHTYDSPGKYTILIYVDTYSFDPKDAEFILSGTSDGSSLLTGGGTNDDIYRNCITDVRLGCCVKELEEYAFKNCHSLKTISLHKDLNFNNAENCFQNCYSLKTIVLPNGSLTTQYIETAFCANCVSLQRVIFASNSGTGGLSSIFYNCYSLKNIIILDGNFFYASDYMFQNCVSLSSITIPKNLNNSSLQACGRIFTNCYSLKRIEVYKTTPYNINPNTFRGLPTYTKIYVPWSRGHSVLAAYKAATYWSDIADQIYQMPFSIENTQAYVQFDSSNSTLTFFRDTFNKYNNNQISGTKTYYTGVETTAYNSYDDRPWSYKEFTSVIIENIIRPISCRSFFDYEKYDSRYDDYDTCGTESIIGLEKLDTQNCTNMKFMFGYCQSLTQLDVSNFNTSNVIDMSYMFYDCQSLTQLDVSNFNTSNVETMAQMFGNCFSFTSLDLSSFNTSNVIYTYGMFQYCRNLERIYVLENWDLSKLSSGTDMFRDCNKLSGNSTAYSSSHTDHTYAKLDNPPNEPGYFTDRSQVIDERQVLTNMSIYDQYQNTVKIFYSWDGDIRPTGTIELRDYNNDTLITTYNFPSSGTSQTLSIQTLSYYSSVTNGSEINIKVNYSGDSNFKPKTATGSCYKFGSQITFKLSYNSSIIATLTALTGMKIWQYTLSNYRTTFTLAGETRRIGHATLADTKVYTEHQSLDSSWWRDDDNASSTYTINGITGSTVITNNATYTISYTSSCCFEANTQILTLEGIKSIQDIDIGDTIILQNSSTGERTTTTALKVANIHYPTRTRAIVEFADGKELRYNPYHPIWTTDGYKTLGYYKDLPTLEVGDTVVLQDNTTTTVTNITIEDIPNGDLTTYNLLLAGVEDYYLEDEWGYFANDILVHHGVVNYYDEDEYRARHTDDCVNKVLYENFDFDNSTDEEIISFIVELHSQSEDAYNEYMKYYLTAAQYRKFVTLYPEIKRRISEEVSS